MDRSVSASVSASARARARASASASASASEEASARLEGRPIVLLAAGAAAFIAVGDGAATKGDHQQLNSAAVGVWSAVGAAAMAGGITWWVVGAKRRQRAPTLALHPRGVDLRLRF